MVKMGKKKMMRRNRIPIFILIGLLVMGGVVFYQTNKNKHHNVVMGVTDVAQYQVNVFKSKSCGCCSLYAEALKQKGFKVAVTDTDGMDAIRRKYNIPENMQSCHTVAVDKYFVEGHVPIEAVKRLLKEKPDIDGIALPGMPVGSPGMPGPKKEPFVIYQIKNGHPSEYMVL